MSTLHPPSAAGLLALLLGACGGSGGGSSPSAGLALRPGPAFDLGTRHPVDLAVGDLDEDGSLDIVVADPSTGQIALILNPVPAPQGAPGGVVFAPATADLTTVAVGLFNGDTHLDVVCNSKTGSAGFFAGQGPALLNSMSTQTGAAFQLDPMAAADMDGDGIPDLVSRVVQLTSEDIVMLKGQGDGTFLAPTVIGSSSNVSRSLHPCTMGLAAAPEVGLTLGQPYVPPLNPPQPLRAARVLIDAGASLPQGACIDGVHRLSAHDMDRDGDDDLLALTGALDLTVLRLENGTLVEGPRTPLGLNDSPTIMQIAAGNVDRAGPLDAVVASAEGQQPAAFHVTIWQASGSAFVRGTPFALPAGHLVADLLCADLDGDGDDDIVVLEDDLLSGVASTVRILLSGS